MTNCMGCKHCIFTDDGETMAIKCTAKTKKGKAITWHMHTGSFQNGVFVPDDENEIREKMKEIVERRKIPFWCPNKDNVEVICYNEHETWENRSDAIAFYLKAMASSEGSEHARYRKIVSELKAGNKICTDID